MFNKRADGEDCIVAGKVSTDPQMNDTQSGGYIFSFLVGQGKIKGTDEYKPSIKVKAFNRSFDIVKGDHIIAAGNFEVRKYKDKEDNEKTSYELLADFIAVEQHAVNTPSPKAEPTTPASNDGLPF
jgi:single-stranded DNA-binding protein